LIFATFSITPAFSFHFLRRYFIAFADFADFRFFFSLILLFHFLRHADTSLFAAAISLRRFQMPPMPFSPPLRFILLMRRHFDLSPPAAAIAV